MLDLIRSFRESLQRHGQVSGKRRFVVAFSGGLDSTVLLDLARRVLPHQPGAALLAVHVDHRLHPESPEWGLHCETLARALGVAATVTVAQAAAARGDSPEAAARAARYDALQAQIAAGDVLLTAHHRDDQLETVLLQLMRGAGTAGLAGMPELRPFGGGWHLRPLLTAERRDLRAYADACGLNWLDDPGNAERRFDRNFVRHEIVPLLRLRWPAVAAAVARSARHCAEADAVLRGIGAADRRAAGDDDNTLRVDVLRALSAPRARLALRAWIAEHGLAVPRATHLDAALRLLEAREAGGCVDWPGVELRRYRDRLYLMKPLAPAPGDIELPLPVDEKLRLPAGLGSLGLRREGGGGLDPGRLTGPLTVRFRAGGERIRPHGSACRRELRKLYQEDGVVPWMRERIPLIYAGDRLVAVADLWLAHELAAADGVVGLRPDWENRPRLY